jgi:ribulose 1,5-bisphosphate synthetase/thiazole synthase
MRECYIAARLARESLQFDVVIVGAGPAGLSGRGPNYADL